MSGQHRRLREARPERMDAVDRRKRFEAEHPEVPIVPPGNQWHAILPLGKIPGRPDGTTVSGRELAGLMDQLEEIYPPQDEPGAGPG